jgi:hypothetical protein
VLQIVTSRLKGWIEYKRFNSSTVVGNCVIRALCKLLVSPRQNIFGAIFLAKENNTRIKDSIGLLTAEISTLFNIEQYATADA